MFSVLDTKPFVAYYRSQARHTPFNCISLSIAAPTLEGCLCYAFGRASIIDEADSPHLALARACISGQVPLYLRERARQLATVRDLDMDDVRNLVPGAPRVKSKQVLRTSIISLPDVLVLHLSRLVPTPAGLVKDPRPVRFNEVITMQPFLKQQKAAASTVQPEAEPTANMAGADDPPPDLTENYLYRLAAVVVHCGTANSGHFLTYRRGLASSCRPDPAVITASYPDEWVRCDDSDISSVPLDQVLNSEAYLLVSSLVSFSKFSQS